MSGLFVHVPLSPRPASAAANAALLLVIATLTASIDKSTSLYSPYASFTVPFTHRMQNLQRHIAPADQPVFHGAAEAPHGAPQAKQQQKVQEVPQRRPQAPAKLYGQLFVPNIAEEMALMAKREAAPLRPSGYGWEQCEFSPLSCLLRRRRK